MESLKIEETYGYVDFGIPAVAMNLIQDAKAGIVLKKGGPLSAEWYWSKEVSASRCHRDVVADTVLQLGST